MGVVRCTHRARVAAAIDGSTVEHARTCLVGAHPRDGTVAAKQCGMNDLAIFAVIIFLILATGSFVGLARLTPSGHTQR